MQYKSYRYNSESIIQQYHKSKNRLFISQFSMTSQTIFAATMLLVGVLNLQLNHFYDTIIIGAGIAGIGASMVLSNNSVAHLLLEARSRIGGRINSFDFANTTQEMGAAFVQFPRENNIIHPFISALKITEVPVNFQKQTYWYANKSRCTETMLDSVQPVFNSLLNYIYKRAKASNKDEPVSNLVNAFWNTKPNFNGFIKDTVMQYMQTIAVDNGAQLCNLSTLQFNNPDPWDKYDYCPSNGYASFMNSLFNTYCKPKLHLSQIVSKIDYSGCSIAVTTNKKTYTTNKLIIGVPLGILKAGSIEFVPSLPSDKSQAIKSIGNGYFQKLFVTFSSSFWPANSSNLQFITKQNPNRYPEAWVVPSVFSKGLNMLVFWISGDTAKEISGWTINQVKANLIATLVSYIPQAISITNIYLTNWQQDPFTLGSYSFSKVGTKKQDFLSMKTVLRSSVNRLWFVGEYVDPEQYSFSHGAFKTGVQAAKESLLP